MQIVDPVPDLRKLERLARPGSWLRSVAAVSADEIEALRRLCGGHVQRRERTVMLIFTLLGAIAAGLWLLGALGVIDFHVYIGPAGTGPAGQRHDG